MVAVPTGNFIIFGMAPVGKFNRPFAVFMINLIIEDDDIKI